MARTIRYVAAGLFEGFFRTHQRVELNAGDPFPADDRHLIRIYRGTLHEPRIITTGEFERVSAQVTLQQIDNIEIVSGNEWPVPRNRLFSLDTLKLSEVEVSGGHVINGQTYGAIKGKAWCTVVDGDFDKPEPESPDPPGPSVQETTSPDPNPNGRRGCRPFSGWGSANPGCFPAGSGCLIWLLRALLAALVLYWLGTSTQWGRQLVCLAEKWYHEWRWEKLNGERRDLEARIERTRPRLSQCGIKQDFEGDNTIQAFTYTLGRRSGEVVITYDMFTIPDRMEVIFNGRLIAETMDSLIQDSRFRHFAGAGFADGQGELRFDYAHDPSRLNELTIRMVPNQEVATTKWSFQIKCP